MDKIFDLKPEETIKRLLIFFVCKDCYRTGKNLQYWRGCFTVVKGKYTNEDHVKNLNILIVAVKKDQAKARANNFDGHECSNKREQQYTRELEMYRRELTRVKKKKL